MRLVRAAALLVPLMLSAVETISEERNPALADSDSPWNVLAYGGKGEMHGVPICHPLAFFSKSPIPLDFDADFFGVNEADLTTRAQINLLGKIDSQRIYEIRLTVSNKEQRPGVSNPDVAPAIKVLLFERSVDEYCDIYQNQYAYNSTRETDEASIFDIGREKVLKTYETDRHTWFLQYWTVKDHAPLRLNSDSLYTAIQSASPPGALPFNRVLNLTGADLSVDIFGESPNHDSCLLGRVDLQLTVEGNKIKALHKSWIPSSSERVR